MGKKKEASERQYIETKPSFECMVECRKMLESAMRMLSALADEGDTPQRATDLMLQISDIKSHAKFMLYQEE